MNLYSIADGLSIGKAWSALSTSDRETYVTLRNDFQRQAKPTNKERKRAIFKEEIKNIIGFIESSPQGREERSIVAGFAIGGPFICVNTRQLKNFMGRCKSSINVSFQDLGYVAVKTRGKAKEVICSVLPSLQRDAGARRQWTVRFSTQHELFQSKYDIIPDFPLITAADLYEDQGVEILKPFVMKQNIEEFDLECFGDIGLPAFHNADNTRTSQSTDNLFMYEMVRDIDDSPLANIPLERSKSEIFDLALDNEISCFF